MKQGKHTYSDGTEIWYKDGNRHRLDGPAIRHSDGTESWWKDDKRHRLNGPAYIHLDGTERWWRDDRRWPKQRRKWWERGS